ncbi:uncharacterized protein VP01_3687g2 [Puccinia sorghi]|uniref:CCHC-type domain-containing protein n=1 Tax=Puccinia sorghi TaxID=27349 RepID=A0A0L6UUE2_9BASI|nr:uncharacterized protein VP01_3687g2 [Puccinia sorghi]
MDALNAHLDKLMRMMAKEHAQLLAMEETVRQTQARLNATADQQNPAPAQPNPAPAPASNPMVLAKPQPFDGPPGSAAETFFDQNHRHFAEVALWNLHQTGIMSTYMQDFNQHAGTVGWGDTPLMSLYQHSLKENIQIAVVMSNVEFDSLTVNASDGPEGVPAALKPNVMDLSALQMAPSNQLSNTKRARRVQKNLCFHCGQAGHISPRCLNGGRNKLSQHLPQRQ